MGREAGAEIYCAATIRDQAKIVWSEAARMRDKSPALSSHVRKFVGSLVAENTGSKMVPLGADADTLDGLNPHMVIIDELHAHRTRAVLDVMDSALGARRQPLLAMITTAGSDRASVCWEQRAYAERMLAGLVEDESLFAYVATIDSGDDWRTEAAWRKANPNLGVSVKLDYLERRAARAMKMPGAQNSFRRLHLDEWTDAAEAWLSAGVWEAVQASTLDLGDYRGSAAWLGVDLSSKRDLTALLAVVETEDDQGHEILLAFPRFWMPAEGILERSERDGVDYATWRDQGLITATPGPVVDVAHVAAAIAELSEELDIRGVVGDAYRLAAQAMGHRSMAVALLFHGQLLPALTHIERTLALYDPANRTSPVYLAGPDARVACLLFTALILLFQGYPDRALVRSREALAGAYELGQAFTTGQALYLTGWLHQVLGEQHVVRERTATMMALATEHGLSAWAAHGRILHGWAVAEGGRPRRALPNSAKAWRRTTLWESSNTPRVSSVCWQGSTSEPRTPVRR